MSLTSIAERLSTLRTTVSSITKQIAQLNHLQPPTSNRLENEEARQDLTADIHDALKSCSEDLESISLDIEELTCISAARHANEHGSSRRLSAREQEAEDFARTAVGLRQELTEKRAAFRRAQLQAKRNYESAERRDRSEWLRNLQAAAATSGLSASQENADDTGGEAAEEQKGQTHTQMTAALFANRRGPVKKDANATQDDMLLTASNDVTSSLRATHALLTSELSRSRFAHETLESSNKALEELNDRYTGLDDLLLKSRGLISTLLRSQKSDTWYLETAMKILIATLIWLLFRRLFYGPLWWFLYLPLKLVARMTMAVFGGASALVGGSSVSSSSSSLRVMPSATGRPPSIPQHIREKGMHIPVGAGGAGAKRVNSEAIPEGAAESLSEYLSALSSSTSMDIVAEATPGASSGEQLKEEADRGEEKKQNESESGQGHQVRRADGQVLRERDEATEPKNPKKRMWEEPPAPPPQQERRDEL